MFYIGFMDNSKAFSMTILINTNIVNLYKSFASFCLQFQTKKISFKVFVCSLIIFNIQILLINHQSKILLFIQQALELVIKFQKTNKYCHHIQIPSENFPVSAHGWFVLHRKSLGLEVIVNSYTTVVEAESCHQCFLFWRNTTLK